MNNKKKILIFGGNGFIGNAFAKACIEKNCEITIADKAVNNAEVKNANFIEVDITSLEDMQAKLIDNYDYIFNFASIADIEEADEFFEKTVDVNISGCINTLKFSSTKQIHSYIYASSMYVFGNKGGIYGSSKKISEMLVEKYAEEYSFNFTFLRYGSLYGPEAQSWNSITKHIKNIKKNKKMRYWGNGAEVREYIHIEDAAKITSRCLDDEFLNQAVTITGQQKFTSREVLEMIFETLDIKPDIEFLDSYDGPHYTYTPYTVTPKPSLKIVPTEYIDFSQGLYDVCNSLGNE